MVKVQSIIYVSIPDRASNELKGDTIRFGSVYICVFTYNEIMETIFSREELHYNELIWNDKLKGVMMIVNAIKNLFLHIT